MSNKWTLWGAVCLALALVIVVVSAVLWAFGVWGSGLDGCDFWAWDTSLVT